MRAVSTASGRRVGRTQKAAGFSLVELLAGLTILVMLAAVLIGTLGSIRSRMDETICAGNLRQLHHAFMLYTADNDGELPPRARRRGEGADNNFTWEDLIQPYFGRELEAQSWATALPVFYCPGFVKASEQMGNSSHRVHNGYATSYVCNGRLMPDIAANPGSKPVRLASVPEPSRTLMLTDGVPFPAGPTGTILRVSDTAPGGIGVDFSYHGGRVNALMVDGSVLLLPGRPEGFDVYRNGEFLY